MKEERGEDVFRGGLEVTVGTLNVGTMDADMMERRRRCGRRPGAPEADSNLGVEETWSRKKSDGIISIKPESKS